MMLEPFDGSGLSLESRKCIQRQNAFLADLALHGSIGLARQNAQIPHGTLSTWEMQDIHGFRQRKEAAESIALGVLEKEIHRRGVEGWEREIVYQGKVTGKVREYSDNLLMFRAKRLQPAYKDNHIPAPPAAQGNTQINIHLHPSVQDEPLTIDALIVPATDSDSNA